jgi:hypothetical protein
MPGVNKIDQPQFGLFVSECLFQITASRLLYPNPSSAASLKNPKNILTTNLSPVRFDGNHQSWMYVFYLNGGAKG